MVYLDHLIKESEIPEHLRYSLKQQVKLVSQSNPISLRQIEHITAAVKLALVSINDLENRNFGNGQYDIMNCLIISKVVRSDLYPKFLSATITPEDLIDYLGANAREPKEKIIKHHLFNINMPDHYPYLMYCCWLYLTENEL